MTDIAPETAPPPLEVMRGVIPYFTVGNAAAAADFYAKAFGAKDLGRMAADDGKRLIHVQMEINGGSIMFNDPFPEQGHAANPSDNYVLTLVVEDGQAWFDRAVAAGCEVVMPFQQMFWGDRYGQVRDPFRILWAVNEA